MYRDVRTSQNTEKERKRLNRQDHCPGVPAPQPACPMDGGEYTGRPALPAETVPTMAYVPFQTDRKVFCASEALSKGTLFPVLNKPFKGGCAK